MQAIRGLFGVEASQDEAVVKLEQLKASVGLVRDLFRDKEATEVCCVAAWWGVLKGFIWVDRESTTFGMQRAADSWKWVLAQQHRHAFVWGKPAGGGA